MCSKMHSDSLTVKDFYKNREVFVTGASGFIGKVLIWKFLKSCPDVKTIFLLMRPKKGVGTKERLDQLTDVMIFNEMKSKNPELLEKLQIIDGDCMEKNLGIKEEDKERLKSVSIIFHVAASTRFDDPLKRAILLNTRGALEICKLAESLKSLDCLVHVSTAYFNPKMKFVEEKFYPSDCDWKKYISYAENLDENLLQTLSAKLTKFSPNTYTFSKNLAEQVCAEYMIKKNLPILIYRPSIVIGAENEPFPGWTDNISGISGLFIGIGTGIKRVVIASTDTTLNLIPVDICVNGMMLAAWKKWKDEKVLQQKRKLKVYNAASIKEIQFKLLILTKNLSTEKNPILKSLWYPMVTVSTCRSIQYIRMLFYQWIPAIIFDFISGFKNRKQFLMKLHRKIYAADLHFADFMAKDFHFTNSKFLSLQKELNLAEKKEFYVEEQCKDVVEYTNICYAGGAKFLMKQTPEDCDLAKKRIKILRYVHHIGFNQNYELNTTKRNKQRLLVT